VEEGTSDSITRHNPPRRSHAVREARGAQHSAVRVRHSCSIPLIGIWNPELHQQIADQQELAAKGNLRRGEHTSVFMSTTSLIG
jgi:hypothetical protein